MPDLNCTKFEARLMQAVEDRQTLGGSFEEDSDPQSADWRELRARANACPHCRQLWNEFALLDRVLPIWKDHVPPVDLADAVIARWREEQSLSGQQKTAGAPASKPEEHKKSGGPFLFAVMMVVAVAVLASVPFWFAPQTDHDLSLTFPVATDSQPAAPLPKEWDGPDLKGSVPEETPLPVDWQALAQDAGSAYWILASDAADSFASVKVLVPPRKPAADAPKPEENKPASRWGVEGIGTGLKPIGQDVGKAMGFLFEALPGEPPTT